MSLVPLYMLACDHRGSFRRKLFGDDTLTPENAAHISNAKNLVFEGLLWAVDHGLDKNKSGLLMDTETGADVVAEARNSSVRVAIPVERGGAQAIFQLDHGAEFGKHIEEHDPDYVKALAYYNPEGDRDGNRVQCERLAELSGWVRAAGRQLMLEFMVPATEKQQRSVGGDTGRYDTELRPGLMVETIKEMHKAGVYPHVWKVEGVDTEEHCEQIVAECRDGAADDVSLVVLGRGADIGQVHHWLTTAARVPGYNGFAVGRSIWLNPLLDYTTGRAARNTTIERIGGTYLELARVFDNAVSTGTSSVR